MAIKPFAATFFARSYYSPEPIMTSHENRWNRRELLQHTVAGAALAGLAIVPRHVLGGAGYTPPSEKVNLAMIGLGRRGKQLVEAMAHQNIVALCDVDANYVAEAARRCPKATTHSDFRAMLDEQDKSIDAVVVARRYGRATQHGAQSHASSHCRRVVELIRAGTIGQVREVHT